MSATANPIANSSGSVTNQAIQVLQGPYITNTYGGGVQCQGATFNLTPYLQFSDSRKDPWEDFFQDPQYNLSDFSGRTIKQQVTVKTTLGRLGMILEPRQTVVGGLKMVLIWLLNRM